MKSDYNVIDVWEQTEVIHCPDKSCKGMLLSNPSYDYYKCSDCGKCYGEYMELFEVKNEP